MAGSISDALEIKLLDHVLKKDPFAVPDNIYIALSTADPTEDGSGIAEPVGDGYARVVCNTWDAAESRAIANTGAVEFAEAEGDGWGNITHFAIFDALEGGNFLAHGDLTTPKAIGGGDNASFAAGDIDIEFSPGGASDYLANKLLDHIFKTAPYSQPTNIFVALATATIGDSDTGTTITEPGENYARKGHDAYDAAAAGASENTGEITFVTATASWGTVTDVALVDAATVGNILFYAALDESKAIGNGDTAKFNDGALDFTMD
ncbi:hypothetical protein ES703_95653 [subsurface metagenome]